MTKQKIQEQLGIVAYNIYQKNKELKELEKQFDQLQAQFALMQNIESRQPKAREIPPENDNDS